MMRGLSKNVGRLEESERQKNKSSAPRGSGSSARRGGKKRRRAAASGGGSRAHIIGATRRPLPARLVLRVAGSTQLAALVSVMIFFADFVMSTGPVLRHGLGGTLVP